MVAIAALLTACGGGRDDEPGSIEATAQSAADDGPAMPLATEAMGELTLQALHGTLNTPASVVQLPESAETPTADETPDMTPQWFALRRITPAAPVAAPAAAPFGGLPRSNVSLLADVRPSARCQAGYNPPAWLVATRPVPLAEPMTLSQADLAKIRLQASTGPFLRQGDFVGGSPGEMTRVANNATRFVAKGESKINPTNAEGLRPTHGTIARDAAFVNLLQPSAPMLARVRLHLLAQVDEPANDFSNTLCLRQLDGSVRDAWYAEANWLSRFTSTYDMARAGLADADKVRIENFIRRNAYFLAAQLDYGFNYVFPARAQGNYATRAGAASASTADASFLSQRLDTNGDCQVNTADSPQPQWVHAYTRSDGSSGPRLSLLSQWYNNRKSASALAIGMAGILLNDGELATRAKRYFMEWLAYSVYPDGSEGEYARNGDYCIAGQGVVYAASNIQGAVLLGDMLARRGDRGLIGFSTRDGLHGTEVANPQAPAKSLATVVATHLQLANGQRNWYPYRGSLATGLPSPVAHLGRMDVRFNGTGGLTDNYHQLGLLLGAKHFPTLPVRGLVLRDRAVTNLGWPGSSGNAVATGFGSWVGAWTDVFNVYPTALLNRAE
jgi:hypothetical protein